MKATDPSTSPLSGDALRLEIWRLAAQPQLAEQELVQRLLDLLGVAVGAASARRYRFSGDTVTCDVEWRRPDVPSALGVRFPASTVQDYVGEEWLELDPQELIRGLDAERHATLRATLAAGIERDGPMSSLVVPYAIDGRVEGVITLQRAAPVAPGWTTTLRPVLGDLVQIVSQALGRRRTEEARRASDAAFAALFELAADPILIVSRDGRLLDVNAAACRHLGYGREDLLRLRIEDIALDPWRDPRLRQLGTLGSVVLDSVHVRKDGREVPVEVSFAPVRFRGEGAACCIVRDVTERRRAERELRESEQRFRELAEMLPQAVYEFDLRGRVTFINRSGLELLDVPEGDGTDLDLSALVLPEDLPHIRANFADTVAGKLPPRTGREYRIVSRDGRLHDVNVYSAPILRDGAVVGLRGVGVDVTETKRAAAERQRLEAKMVQAQKLESLGLLAGGIAHDFNNLLFGILGNAELALADPSRIAEVTRRLGQIRRGAQRASELANQMLAYSGRGEALIEPVDLSALVEEMSGLLDSAVTQKGVLRLDLGRGLPVVEADLTQVRQVVMNLILNASEALADGAGQITVRTGVLDAAPDTLADAWGAEDLEPGRFAFVEVVDTGVGMDAATRARIFDPFFTTKFTGRGLGLAAVLGIVRRHRGAVIVVSAPGRGTTFRVLLPAADERAAAAVAPIAEDAWSGHGTVLVVDDEAEVRDVASEMLQALGFAVETAASATAALELVPRLGSALRAVVLDVTMPGLSGLDALPRLRELAPGLPVVIASGYGEAVVPRGFALGAATVVVQKPFGLAQLQRTLRAVLGG